jgi:YqaJ-like viral recombinase domain
MTQRDPKWRADKIGIISASRFADAMASPSSKRYQAYRDELIDERIGLINMEDFIEKPWFRHGIEMEPRGLAALSFFLGARHPSAELVIHPDFIRHPEGRFGCSPDTLILPPGDRFGAELKCRLGAEAQWKAISSGLDSVYRPQVQGSMWVTGARFWYYASYCEDERLAPRYRLHVEVIARDDDYIARISSACARLDADVEVEAQKILEALS